MNIYKNYILLLLTLGLSVVAWLSFSSNQEIPAKSEKINLKITAPKIPKVISFAGETVPLKEYGIFEKLDNELISNTYFHSNTIKMFKRASRWFPLIVPILKEHNIPEDFKYLALTESGLQNVTSPAGAKGFWQFMKTTAKEYGLEVNKDIDERYHVLKETHAACEYLNDAYEKYGNWTLAAASYNAGMKKISAQLEKQKTNDYYNLSLNTETSRYIFRIMAIKLIFEDPEKYGFYLNQSDLYHPIKYRTIKIDTTINKLIDFAIDNGTSYRILKASNPWLRSDRLPDESRKVYEIKIPK